MPAPSELIRMVPDVVSAIPSGSSVDGAAADVHTDGDNVTVDGTTFSIFPWWDGGIAMFSVAAQILQSRRHWESWLLWIAVDIAAVPLFTKPRLERKLMSERRPVTY